MKSLQTAILTVVLALDCTSGAMSPGGGPPELPARFEASRPRAVLVSTTSGDRNTGPWKGFDADALLGEAGRLSWADLVPADRLRAGRAVLRAADGDPAEGWALLLVALDLASTPEDLLAQVRLGLERAAGADADRLRKAAEARVTTLRADRAAAAARLDASAVRRVRPHLEASRIATWRTVPSSPRTPEDIQSARNALRSIVEAAVEGLDRETVPTSTVIVNGPGSLDSVAATGVSLDRWLDEHRRSLGTGLEPPPGGGLAVIETRDLDEARVLAARHRVDWPIGEASVLVPRPEGLLAILPPPDPDRIDRWRGAVPSGSEAAALREVELARLAARAAITEAGGGRVPAWLVEGFAEAASQRLVPHAPLERLGRASAVAAIRAGRHPAWITDLESGDEAWAPEGPARWTAHLLATRLLEHDDAVVPGLVADLAAGATVDEAFRRRTGLTLAAWLADSIDWYRTND